MCDSRAPLNGADSEPLDPRDASCDLCGKTIYDGSLRAESHGGSVLYKCSACRRRDAERYERGVAA